MNVFENKDDIKVMITDLRTMNMRKGEISGMLDVSVYAMDFFKLSKMRRPSSTPVTMDAKLSSRRIMSAACFDTSEPVIPIATPGKRGDVFLYLLFFVFLSDPPSEV